MVQEAWLRLARTDDIDDLPAWLTTVVTRLCLDRLRQRRTRSRAEAHAPVDATPVDPEADAVLAERVSGALQVVLDTLAPAERAAFVLHDVFGYPFDRDQRCSRAIEHRRHASWPAGRDARFKASPSPPRNGSARAESRRVVDAFITAARGGELDDPPHAARTRRRHAAPISVARADGDRRRSTTGRMPWPARFNGSRGSRAGGARRRPRRGVDHGSHGQGGLRVSRRGRPGARDRADRRPGGAQRASRSPGIHLLDGAGKGTAPVADRSCSTSNQSGRPTTSSACRRPTSRPSVRRERHGSALAWRPRPTAPTPCDGTGPVRRRRRPRSDAQPWPAPGRQAR